MMMIAFLVFFFGLVLCELNLNLFSVVWCDVIVRCCTLDPLILCVKASNSKAILSVQCVCFSAVKHFEFEVMNDDCSMMGAWGVVNIVGDIVIRDQNAAPVLVLCGILALAYW